MSAMKIPPDIVTILKHPGRIWTLKERSLVQTWLSQPPQLQYLKWFVIKHLDEICKVVIIEDAEEIWQEFNISNLNAVMESYDPAKGKDFWNYLLFCMARFCRNEAQKIQRQENRKIPFEKLNRDTGERIQLEISDVKYSLQGAVDCKTFVYEALQYCLNELSKRQQQVIECYYLRVPGMSIAEIAYELHSKPNTIKTALCRARQNLKNCLAQKGFQ